jgi:hypothetical protein
MGEFKKYAVEMGLGDMIHISSFLKTRSGTQKSIRAYK